MLRSVKQLWVLVALVTAVCVSAAAALAAAGPAGSPDVTFGTNGVASADLAARQSKHDPDSANVANDAAIDSEGRILVAGSRINPGARFVSDLAVVAFGPNGRFDRTWGHNGKVIEKFPRRGYTKWRDAAANAITVSPDGRVYVAGRVDYASDRDIERGYDTEGEDGGELNINRFHFVVRAFTKNGRPVKGFGRRGKILIKSPTSGSGLDSPAQLLDVSAAPDGSIYLLYENDEWKYKVVHLDRRGRRVGSFGRAGSITLKFQKGADTEDLDGARLFPDSKGLVVTYSNVRYEGKRSRAAWVATRLTRRGAPDLSYGLNGTFRKTWPVSGKASGSPGRVEFVQDSDQRILFAGYNAEALDGSILRRGAAMRLLANGQPDPAFATGGIYAPMNADGTPKSVLGITPTQTGRYVVAEISCIADGESVCDPIPNTTALDAAGQPIPTWQSTPGSAIPSNAGSLEGLLAGNDHVYFVFSALYGANRQNARFGASALFE